MTTPTMVHRAQTFKSLGSRGFLFSSMNTNTRLQATAVYKKIKYRNLIVILTMYSSGGCLCLYSFETEHNRKHKKEKAFSIYSNLPLVSFEFITSGS